MIENRKLTKQEFNRLLDEAPDTETRNLKRILGNDAYEHFEIMAKAHFGLLSNGRPIYWAVLSKDNKMWTIVNSEIKEQFSLYKYCKRGIYNWLRMFGKITATMEDKNEKNLKWTMFMGFKIIKKGDGLITLSLNS